MGDYSGRFRFKRRNTVYRTGAIGCIVVIGVLSLIPGGVSVGTGEVGEYLSHLLAYGVLMGLLLLSFGKQFPPILIGSGVILYSCILEVLQAGTPTRDPEWLDVSANSVGVFLGWASTRIVQEFARGRT